MNHLLQLSRRQRQIMDILYRQGESTAEQIREQLPNAPSNSAVRAMLATMEKAGYISHKEANLRYVYSAAIPQDAAQQTAMERLVNTFFEGSTVKAVTALLGMQDEQLSKEEMSALKKAINQAKKKEK